jgi:cobalt-zinc-cadmium efflux system outer membrane protein
MTNHKPAGVLTGVVLCLLAGCVTTPVCDQGCLSGKVAERTGNPLGPPPCAGKVVLPNGVSLTDGLTEEGAILVALWNNAAFLELLADLGVAHGDLVQAGLLPNPEFAYFFNVPNKPYRYAVDLPIEAFWLRPIRVAAAEREMARVCERLTQAALDLIRDVRQAYADVLLAKGRQAVIQDAVGIRGRIARLAEARLKAGDISVQEVTTARIDALQAEQDVARVGYEVSLAEEKLRQLLGIGACRAPLVLIAGTPPARADLDPEQLTAEAVATRPDLLATEQFVAAAAERARLTRLNWARLLGIADATTGKITDHEFGPGLRVTVPIFNWNQGNIARADAELERARRQQTTVRNQIVFDVHQAHFRHAQARAELGVLQGKVLPEADAAIQRAQSAYREGNAPYVVVLEATRQLLDSRLRREVLHADLRRAWADLERSVGRHLDSPPMLPQAKGPTP